MTRSPVARTAALALIVLVAACQDTPTTLVAPDDAVAANVGQDLAAWFARSAPEVMALPQTVFADHDEAGNKLVFGVENPGVSRAVHNVMAGLGIPATAYEVQVTEPIRFMSEHLRTTAFRPVVAGVQLHWSNYVCTLGFNVSHDGGYSFITNSHCTDSQGSTGNTQYNQPSRTASPDPIAFEAHDPAYFRGGACPRGRVCRYSDAARAAYVDGMQGRAEIAKPDGTNNHSLNVVGRFSITSQDNNSTSFSGTMHKVGRTTGWTSGNVTNTCATVNVSGSNITLLCQTLVQRSGTQIVAGGDSGSPVFTVSSDDNVQLRGILWGGSGSGELFVFSPLKNVILELGSMNATVHGTGSGDGGGDNGGGEDQPCVPKGPNGNNCK
jgi:hypothetical protein